MVGPAADGIAVTDAPVLQLLTPNAGDCPVARVLRGALSVVDREGAQAVAVCIVDADGNTAHMYYTGEGIPSIHYAAATMANRLLLHGTQEPLPGEWDSATFPHGGDDG